MQFFAPHGRTSCNRLSRIPDHLYDKKEVGVALSDRYINASRSLRPRFRTERRLLHGRQHQSKCLLIRVYGIFPLEVSFLRTFHSGYHYLKTYKKLLTISIILMPIVHTTDSDKTSAVFLPHSVYPCNRLSAKYSTDSAHSRSG